MIGSFNAWFRANMLQPDGRVVWWEHMVAWVPFPTAVGILLSAWDRSLLPLSACMAMGIALGWYSFVQDRMATRLRQSSLLAKPQTPSKVPHYVSITAVLFLVLLAVNVFKVLALR